MRSTLLSVFGRSWERFVTLREAPSPGSALDRAHYPSAQPSATPWLSIGGSQKEIVKGALCRGIMSNRMR